MKYTSKNKLCPTQKPLYIVLSIIHAWIFGFVDYLCTIIKLLMTKAGNNVIYCQVLKQNHQYKHILWTIYKTISISHLCIMYIINKLQFYFLFVAQKSASFILSVFLNHLSILFPPLPCIIKITLYSDLCSHITTRFQRSNSLSFEVAPTSLFN
jgi:hypothetical protein